MIAKTYEDADYVPRQCTFSPSDWKILSNFWYPIALAKDIEDKPFKVRLLDEDLVVYRTSTGFVVAKDLCVHRGSPLSYRWIEGDEIVCGYHGYRYNPEGRCTLVPSHPDWKPPSKLCLKIYLHEERYGVIWACLSGQPANVIPDWDMEWNDKDFRWFSWGPIIWECSAGRAIENFIDNAHFSFIHRSTFGQASSAEMGSEYELTSFEHGLVMDFDYLAGNPHDSPIQGTDQIQRHMTRTLNYPFFTRSRIQYPEGREHIIHIIITPVSARKSQFLFLFSRNFDHHVPVEELLTWEKKILLEDRNFIESQKPEEIPLDLSEEVHVRADKSSVAMRRWMIKIGLGRDFTA